MTINEHSKNPSTHLIKLVEGLKRLCVVNVEVCENRRNSAIFTIIMKEGTTKTHILDILHRGFCQDHQCIELAKGSVNWVNWGPWIIKQFQINEYFTEWQRNCNTGTFWESMTSSWVRGHQANSSDPMEKGGVLEPLKKGGCNIPSVMTATHNQLCYPSNFA